MNTHTQTLDALQDALLRLQRGKLSAAALSQWARDQQPLLQALPDKFSVVLNGLLDRLESSALFAEESCSFSQQDLLDSLRLWIDKARPHLNTPTA